MFHLTNVVYEINLNSCNEPHIDTTVREKRVGKGGGANVIFRFHDFGYWVEIEICISLDSLQKRREADANFKFMKYVVQETTLFSDVLGKIWLK